MSGTGIGAVTEAELAELRAVVDARANGAGAGTDGVWFKDVARLLATIAAEKAAHEQDVQGFWQRMDAKDAEIARLNSTADALAAKARRFEDEREYNADLCRKAQSRVAQLEAALRQAALDIGNAAAFLMLAGRADEAAVMTKCDEAARAALTPPSDKEPCGTFDQCGGVGSVSMATVLAASREPCGTCGGKGFVPAEGCARNGCEVLHTTFCPDCKETR